MNREEFYVAARLLEATAKSDPTTAVEASVYARVAERADSGGLEGYEELTHFFDEFESGMTDEERKSGGGRAVELLRRAAEEVREEGRAEIAEKVDDSVVASLRSEFDAP
jgi:hypothetical protein